MEQKLHKYQLESPRYDLLTGEILPYKSKEFYFNNLYANRRNLISHFKTLDKDEMVEITKEILSNRIKLKNLIYAPSTVELKSLVAPSILLLDHYGINYNKICEGLGLKTKYKYSDIKLRKVKLIDKIIVDSREQQPLLFGENVNTEILCLNVGDYCKVQDVTNQLVVEKKSLSDLLGTISKDLERFCRELTRAEEKNANVLVVVDTKFSSALSFNYLPHIHSKA